VHGEACISICRQVSIAYNPAGAEDHDRPELVGSRKFIVDVLDFIFNHRLLLRHRYGRSHAGKATGSGWLELLVGKYEFLMA